MAGWPRRGRSQRAGEILPRKVSGGAAASRQFLLGAAGQRVWSGVPAAPGPPRGAQFPVRWPPARASQVLCKNRPCVFERSRRNKNAGKRCDWGHRGCGPRQLAVALSTYVCGRVQRQARSMLSGGKTWSDAQTRVCFGNCRCGDGSPDAPKRRRGPRRRVFCSKHNPHDSKRPFVSCYSSQARLHASS